MRAARLHAYGKPLHVDEVDAPEPGPGQVLVRVAGAGVCHSDLHVRSGEVPVFAEDRLPVTLGHEVSGWVERLGEGAEGRVAEGEPVLVYGGWGCGACHLCLSGDEQLCDLGRWVGLGPDGGYADLLLVPAERHLVPLGEQIDPVTAAPLADAALTPWRAVRAALPRLTPGAAAVVIGCGGLGQMGVQMLHRMTGARVIALDVAEDKLERARAMGADLALDPREEGVVDRVRQATGGEGAGVVFDYVGNDATLDASRQMVARRGRVVILGLGGGALASTFLGMAAEATVTTSHWGNRVELGEVVAMADRGLIELDVERHPLEEVDAVLDRLERGEVPGRAVVTPGG